MIMDKQYQANLIENKWYPIWEQQGYFKPSGTGKSFCIVIPPPNVTGRLHMGHGFQHTLMDVLIRYHRMQGDNTLWQVGTDHAGISTQMVVERLLKTENTDKHQLGREAFLDRVWQWKVESGNQITAQMRRLGNATDWSRERFTMDDDLSKAVRKVFIQLYDEGLIYRGKRLVNWDPVLQTAISDVEVLNVEKEGSMWHIRYPLVDSDDYLVVATTRPETLLGDSAVAVNPNDERYQHLIGKAVQLPLTDRTIPIIADDYVDADFGTGCVKITPAHDFNDYEVGQRHQLPLINILTKQAFINDHAPVAYRGLDRFVARKRIVNDLDQTGLLEKIEPHKLMVPTGDRGGAVIEPLLTDQWYVSIKPLAKPAIDAVKQGQVRFVPDNWSKTYFQWMENIQDWCISRQLWWGHQIPAWYDQTGTIYVAENEASVREKYKLDATVTLTQETDVLDTWFSSALWPFSTLGWPEDTAELQTLFPTSVLVTGFDIIFFWVARMIMFSLKFTGKVPFSDVYITGLIRDEHGQKMSKTKGNVLDPIDLVEGITLEDLIAKRTYGLMQTHLKDKIIANTKKQFPQGISAFGVDALRYTYCSLATTGRDIRFDLGRLEGYHNFGNKIWNASRFVLSNVTDFNNTDCSEVSHVINRWMLHQLQTAIDEICSQLNQYRFDLASQKLYEFIWHDFCDWFLEFSKLLLADNTTRSETQLTLLQTLEAILRLLHPFMPFISEEIWQTVTDIPFPTLYQKNAATTIQLQAFPKALTSLINTNIATQVTAIQEHISQIRKCRSENNIAPSKTVSLWLNVTDNNATKVLEQHQQLISSMTKTKDWQWLTAAPLAYCATIVTASIEYYIPLSGVVDLVAEKAKLNNTITKLTQEIEKINRQLANEKFVDNAPFAVVEKQRLQLADYQQQLLKIERKLQAID